GEEAVEVAKELQPDIVLMDINLPGMDGITASELITRQSPTSQIIMMSVQGEADYLRRSMLAGAREFLIKPFSSDELVSSIKRVYELAASRPAPSPLPQTDHLQPVAKAVPPAGQQGRVISVFGPKGGVGCSTIAANLAIAIHEAGGLKVALVDGNLQFGGVDVLLNLQTTRTIADVVTKVEDLDAELLGSAMMPHPSGIKVLLAPPRPEMADLVHPEHMRAILAQLRQMFDYVVVDTWTSLHDLTLSVLDSADRIVLVATPEVPAIKNAKVFFDVADALDYPPEKTWLVINQADRRGAIRTADIEGSIKHPIAAAIPMDERAVFMAANQGIPLVVSHRNSGVAQAIFALAARVRKELEVPAEPAQETGEASEPKAHTGLLERLFKA
ncbi:MAG: response regulator, partial [Anaerolineae bacterium]|nr:response regulator [Anaerolineae bacterium]